MKHILLFIIGAITIAHAQETGFYENQLLVMLKNDQNKETLLGDFNQNFPNARVMVRRDVAKHLNVYLLEFDKNNLHYEQALRFANNHPGVAIAQYNHNNLVVRATPNDPQFPQMWGLLNDGFNGNVADADIDADEAWDIETGGSTVLGDEIVVAVIDNGFSLSHLDLDYWTNTDEIPSNGTDDDNDGYVDDVNGWNAYDQDGNITSASHGTHVAGTIGAKGNNNIGVVGVNWNVKVMAIQGSSTNEATVLEAYGYAHQQRKLYNTTNGAEGAYVVSTNSSFGVDQGQPSAFPLWCAFYDSLGAVGIISAGATANQDWDIDAVGDVPTGCSSPYMIAVTNTTSSDQKSNFAGYGATTIDIGAPGSDILSTLPGNNYGELSGTSMATPHVAGTIALMYATACEDMLNAFANDPQGLALEMRNHLIQSGWDANTNLNGITVTGGRLNLYKALVAVLGNGYCQPEGITEVGQDYSTTIYPNPTKKWLNVDDKSQEVESIGLMDCSGRLIKEFWNQKRIDVSGFTPGVYMMRVKYRNNKSSFSKLIIAE